ncbi:Chemotaxis protein CheY [Planctomycetes bacterium Poly30]|uniref:Chemotaxis protein CheY n=1 Tax=Saltatorellus ferox TaxID=2528018 RepID=A0A518F0T3_9BACT|nr:Chemotaxis protein CheY [Planctomycetes bacterium Poly30]
MKAIVTDDSKATRMILAKLLTDFGFDVQTAEDGPKLLEMLTDAACDLCLVDWNMPGMNGTQVIRTLQAHPDWKLIPAIIVTDETKKERIASALEAGAIGYLPKPFEKNALAEILQSAGVGMP